MSGHALSIQGLWKTYSGQAVVRGLDLEIASGEIFGLLGPNGAGKSTTINLVSGVARMEKGTVRVFGHDNRAERGVTRRLVGVMHQEIVHEPFFEIGEALRIHPGFYGVRDDPKWRETLVERLALGPHLKKKMIRLSGGMKRRFMVAKALLHKPRLLILDEPTAGVDVELRRSLWDFVREINAQGTTVLLTTHYLEEAQSMCGRLAVMKDGGIVAIDTTSNLMKRLGRLKLHVRLQAPLSIDPKELSPVVPEVSPDRTTLDYLLKEERDTGLVLASLFVKGVSIVGVETKSASLEDVFLSLVG